MNSRRWQKGDGKAGVIFWLLIFVAAGIVAKAWIPVKISDMEFKDHLIQLAERYPQKEGKFFQDQIMHRAGELDIPLKAKDVTVNKTAARVRYKIHYVQELDLIFTTFNLEFRHNFERDIFLI